MNILINPQVYDDLSDIKNYIAEDNETQANKVVSEILQDIQILTNFPETGALLSNKVKCDKKYRYLIRYSYATIYRIENDNVIIVSVVHLKRDFSHLNFI